MEETSLHFLCPCGRSLSCPMETAGQEMECPWCGKPIVVPDRSGAAAVDYVEEPEAEAPTPTFQCPGCGSPGFVETCVTCRTASAPIGEIVLHPAARSQNVIPAESADWILRKTRWLMSRVGFDTVRKFPLVLPTAEFFPAEWTRTPEVLDDVLGRMQGYAGLSEARVRLDVGDQGVPIGDTETRLRLALPAGAAGCIYAPRWKNDTAWILLDPELLQDRHALVSTLAHELGHLFNYTRLDLLERSPLDVEQLTDLVTMLLGFGVLTCDSAFRFKTWTTPGWSWWSVRRLGYLSQPEMSFALATICALRGNDPAAISSHLGVNPRGFFQQAIRLFQRSPDLAEELRRG